MDAQDSTGWCDTRYTSACATATFLQSAGLYALYVGVH